MKLIGCILVGILSANLHADQKVAFGGFECSVPDDWKKYEEVRPRADILTYVSPKSLIVGGKHVSVLVHFGTGPGVAMTLDQYKTGVEKQIAAGDARAKDDIGIARTGKGLLKSEDFKDVKCEIINIGGKRILRGKSVTTINLNGDLVAYKQISFLSLEPKLLHSLSIIGPLGLVEEYAKEMESILASVKLNTDEQGGTGQPATAPESKPEGKNKPQPESEPAP